MKRYAPGVESRTLHTPETPVANCYCMIILLFCPHDSALSREAKASLSCKHLQVVTVIYRSEIHHHSMLKASTLLPDSVFDLIKFLYYLHMRTGCKGGMTRVTAFYRIASLQSFHLRSIESSTTSLPISRSTPCFAECSLSSVTIIHYLPLRFLGEDGLYGVDLRFLFTL